MAKRIPFVSGSIRTGTQSSKSRPISFFDVDTVQGGIELNVTDDKTKTIQIRMNQGTTTELVIALLEKISPLPLADHTGQDGKPSRERIKHLADQLFAYSAETKTKK